MTEIIFVLRTEQRRRWFGGKRGEIQIRRGVRGNANTRSVRPVSQILIRISHPSDLKLKGCSNLEKNMALFLHQTVNLNPCTSIDCNEHIARGCFRESKLLKRVNKTLFVALTAAQRTACAAVMK